MESSSALQASPSDRPGHSWTPAHLAALLGANFALALGPLLVRMADTGPIAAGFWRLALALPILLALSLKERAGQPKIGRTTLVVIALAGVFFAFDLASWHVGIEKTKLGNASLFGNSGSLILMAWGLIAARRSPRLLELGAIAFALAGAGLLMSGSLEISHESLIGDLFCLLAGFFYAFYILLLANARGRTGQFSLLFWSSLAGAPVLLTLAMSQGETIIAQNWTPLILLMLGSQLIGQGLLIYSLKHFPPLVIGLALLTQPAISAWTGWLAYDETLSAGDLFGMVLLAGALAMAKAGDKP